MEQAISDLESRAKERREFAASPVKIDTSGQPNWMGKLEEVRREYMESPEQKAAREKRERTNRRIAAISDGLVALSNVAGAMGGATPIKPASLSEAHRIAVERAAKRRRENAARFETAQRYYSGLQYKQDKDNADRHDKEVKARRDAGKEVDDLIGEAARLRLTKDNADRADERARQRQQEQERHNRESESTARVKVAKTGSSSVGGINPDAYNYWMSLTEKEKQQYRDWNNRGRKVRTGTDKEDNPTYGTQYLADDSKFINLVWEQRKAYLENEGREDEIASGGYNKDYRARQGGKKKVSGFGGSQSSGKKKIAGFGK